jgi:hypothetical protein
LVYDGTNRTFYINGQFAGSGNAPAINSDTSNSAIGSVGTLGAQSSFNGLIDEVSIYNRALSFDEIAGIYLTGSYGKCEEVPPTILTQPQSRVTVAGSNVVFNVNAVGEQPLHYYWQLNGVKLTDGGNMSGSTNASLIISNILSSNVGTYSVIVSNAFGFVTSLNAVLAVNILQNGGFESGNLNGWTQSGAGGAGVTTSSTYVHTGNYGVYAGPGGSLGYLSQTIPTVAGQSYLLSFWLYSPGGAPNEFLVAWNGNALFDQTNIPTIGWTNMQFIVTATGVSTGLEFGFRNDPGYFGLDDIGFGAISAPPLRLSGAGFSTNGGFQLAVNGQIGQAYTLQASTNLVDWVSILNFTCTNSPMYVVDSPAKNYGRRFYRLAQGTLLVPVSPIVLGFGLPPLWTTNGLSLMLQGPAGSNYTIQTSADLLIWLPITNFMNANSPLYFYDPQAKNYKQRFYRAVTAP